MNARYLLAALFAALITSSTSLAEEVYRWRDENGVMQYTQTPPPPGVRFKREKLDEVPGSEPDATSEKDETTAPSGSAPLERTATREELPETPEQKAAREARCKEARSRLDYYRNTPAVRMLSRMESGEVVRLTPELHESRMAQFREAIERNCR